MEATKTAPIISRFKGNIHYHSVTISGALGHFWHLLLLKEFRFLRTQEIKLEGFPPTHLSY